MTGKKRNKSSAKNSPPSKRVKNNNDDNNKEEAQSKQKVFECTVCQKYFSSYFGFKQHENIHTGAHECSVCHKRFHTHRNLRDHEDIHTGAKRYSCPHCQKSYRHYNSMWSHKQICSLKDSSPSKQEKNNNGSSPIRAVAGPGQCCACHGGDSSPGHLAEHSTEILTKIGIIDEDDDDETQPTCVVCYRVFETKLKYIKHLAMKHSIIYSFLTARYLRSTSKGDSGNGDNLGKPSTGHGDIEKDKDDQGISYFGGYKEDNNFDNTQLSGHGVKGGSCSLDVSTQTEESQDIAEEMAELSSFLTEELEKYLENRSCNIGTQTMNELSDEGLGSLGLYP